MDKEKLSQLLKIDQKKARIEEINKLMSEPAFWQDRQKAQEITQELSGLQNLIKKFESATLPEELKELEIQAMLSGEYDQNNAILAIHAGSGGTEAQDWAEMLERMFLRYAERKGFKAEILDTSRGEEAGIKSATIRVVGPAAFGWLKSEAGVHRLVRLSPFDADHARHTSFVLVEVIPEIEKAATEIKPEDLKIDVFRSGGHGGQSVNTTDSAVRITHLPTGVVVSCQNERSQMQNKAIAMKILQSRLNQLELKKRAEKEKELRGEFLDASWGNQIRSYVLHPYKLVKDHRTGFESKEPEKVLDGELEEFVKSYLLITNRY